VRKDQGLVEQDESAWRGYAIFCLEHAPGEPPAPPKPPEVSKMPSIHRGDERYER
jgi:hypothetical protein